ncbi:MAG: AEC family transporter [Sedimentisphaerales bacterium]|nr:AEC family transporter [Sedimentisphaerales bacterium]
MQIINTLLPVFLIMAVGAFLRKIRFFSEEFVNGLNKLVFWVGLPCLLFGKIVTAEYDYAVAGKTTLVVIAGTLGCVIAAYITAFIIRIRPQAVGTFVQGAFRGNLYYVGLALIIYIFAGADAKTSTDMENIAVFVLALLIPIYNIGAVIVLLASQHKIDHHVPIKVAREIIANPLFIACVSGGICLYLLPPLPLFISRSCEAIGAISLPLALIGIGGVLVQSKVAGSRLPAITASVIKVALAPVIGYWAAGFVGLGANETKIALLLLACPTAVTAYVVAEQLGGDDKLSAAIIVVSTFLSIISLSVVIGLF